MTPAFREALHLLRRHGNAVALTGAGISVESGIPAFRGAQGLWSRYDPAEYASIEAFLRDPEKVWSMLFGLFDVLSGAVPNAAHAALADLERFGVLRSVITQNVDGLHQAAGSRRVIEFHGNAEELVCLFCGSRFRAREKLRRGVAPRCGCGRILKPELVLFGEAIPEAAQRDAETEARCCGVLLVVGTSAEVAPACDIPRLAVANGAAVIEINPEETGLTRSVADVHLREKAGPALSVLLREWGSPGEARRPPGA